LSHDMLTDTISSKSFASSILTAYHRTKDISYVNVCSGNCDSTSLILLYNWLV